MIIGEKKQKNRKRLSLFFSGVLIGSLFMYAMVFKDKDYFKTPEQTIKEQLKSRKFVITELGSCKMKCLNISETEIKQFFVSGTVNYNVSEVHKKPCKEYAIEGKTTDKQSFRIVFALCDLETKVLNISNLAVEKDTCNCK